MGKKIVSSIEKKCGGKVSKLGKRKNRKVYLVDTKNDSVKAFEDLRRSIHSLPADYLEDLQSLVKYENQRRTRK